MAAAQDGTRARAGGEVKTVAWDAAFSVNSAGRDYYLISEGYWQFREGCGTNQYALWGFHVKTRTS